MQESINSTKIHKGAVFGNIFNNTFNEFAFFEGEKSLTFEGGINSLHKDFE